MEPQISFSKIVHSNKLMSTNVPSTIQIDKDNINGMIYIDNFITEDEE